MVRVQIKWLRLHKTHCSQQDTSIPGRGNLSSIWRIHHLPSSLIIFLPLCSSFYSCHSYFAHMGFNFQSNKCKRPSLWSVWLKLIYKIYSSSWSPVSRTYSRSASIRNSTHYHLKMLFFVNFTWHCCGSKRMSGIFCTSPKFTKKTNPIKYSYHKNYYQNRSMRFWFGCCFIFK